ncbi:MAG TPA: hypothetical protein VLE97_10305 [Gaiellaceae bacterium]|nr:hypothetical protein [Gaiellaceae bacterium]
MTGRAFAVVAVRSRIAGRHLAVATALLLMSALLARLLTEPLRARLAVAFVLGVFTVALALVNPRHLFYALIVWLGMAAFVRRLFTEIVPPSSHDVLVLVGVLGVVSLTVVAYAYGAFRDRSRLANGVLVFSVLALLGAANPKQGGVAVGLAGLLFVLVPMLAFWIGRTLDDHTLSVALKIIAVIAIPAAIYGLAQTLSGFPYWDADWLAQVNGLYHSGTIHGAQRPFANFSSTQEYVMFVAVGLLVWLFLGSRPIALSILICVVGLLGTALVYSGVRGVLVMSAVALGMTAAVRQRLPIVFSLPVIAALLFALSYGAGRVVPDRGASAGNSSTLTGHSLSGLAHPLNKSSSTLPLHFNEIVQGVKSIRTEPLGTGLGSISLAATKFGGAVHPTEADPSNAAVALGLPGLLVYLFIVVVGLSQAYRFARTRGDRLAYLGLAIVTLTLLQWLNGGLYSVAFLPWLILGWVDRSTARESATLPLTL